MADLTPARLAELRATYFRAPTVIELLDEVERLRAAMHEFAASEVERFRSDYATQPPRRKGARLTLKELAERRANELRQAGKKAKEIEP